ncbi:hypothetical protein ACIPJG_32275 [Streptomyces halstedii]|uniref:hypothetical protein n=1 Tax=Streptomyces halstedii TaxID=1944 RepID=UPI003809DAA0
MAIDYSEHTKGLIQKEHLEDLRLRIINEMTSKILTLTPDSAEFLLQTYTDKLAELYY